MGEGTRRSRSSVSGIAVCTGLRDSDRVDVILAASGHIAGFPVGGVHELLQRVGANLATSRVALELGVSNRRAASLIGELRRRRLIENITPPGRLKRAKRYAVTFDGETLLGALCSGRRRGSE